MAVLPAVAPGAAGIGCGIARPVVLTIGVRVVLRAIAGFFDDGLRANAGAAKAAAAMAAAAPIHANFILASWMV